MKETINKILFNHKTGANAELPEFTNQPSLAFCLTMDLIGYISFAVPFLGEASDLIWAPLSGLIFFKAFGGTKGKYGGLFAFAEEALPFLDFIPTFSLMWAYQRLFAKKPLSKKVIDIKPA